MSAEWIINEPEKNCYAVVYRNAISDDFTNILYNQVAVDCNGVYQAKTRGGIVNQARKICLYADSDITKQSYSGADVPAMPWPESVRILRDYVSRDGFVPNSALVNGYIDPDNYVGFHRDSGLVDGRNIVATVSLGGSRRFVFQNYHDKSIKHTTYLNNGDLVYFYGDTNNVYEHSILKALKSDDRRPRYSITFRVIKKS